jgi:hypothetical protein
MRRKTLNVCRFQFATIGWFVKTGWLSLVILIVACLGSRLSAQSDSSPSPKSPATPQPDASRVLTKLPEKYGNGIMECTPIIFQGRQLLFGCYRPSRDCGFAPATNYLAIYDHTDGRELVRFGEGHSLGCAIVEGDTIHVFAPDSKGRGDAITADNWFQNIQHFSSTDLKNWKREMAIPRADGEHLLNSSVCRDEQGYLMSYETDAPVPFCFKFARSKDLSHWEKVPGLAFTGEKKEYSACPVIRYFKPYYYVIYLHAAIPGHNGWVSFLARSKDLATWQLSPKNPILEAGEGEGSNNSDVDLIEIDGKTYVYYATGDQETWGDLKRAVYPGPMREFFASYFPEGATMTEVSARVSAEDAHVAAPISPSNAAIPLFNGKNLDGLYTWTQDAKYDDPRKVFTVEDGMLHISGDAMGYVCTQKTYKDYHLVVEYRWGGRTWGSRKDNARDSGVIVHCAEPDGSWNGVFMAGIEAQIIEGGTGDLIVVDGKRTDGSAIPVSLTVEMVQNIHGGMVWRPGSPRTTLHAGRLNWFGHDPEWKDTLGFRGKDDIDSPGKEWTRLDVISDGGHIIYRVNGTQASEGFDAQPSSGRILLQSEGAEIYVRRFELLPLQKEQEPNFHAN